MSKPGVSKPGPSGEFARFTNRGDQQALFRSYVFSPTAPPVLMFFGVGGAGKTWLLRKIRQQVPADIPSAWLDFDVREGGQFLADPGARLYTIKDQLGQETPRLDLAFAMMRHKQGVAEEPGFKGAGAFGFAWELAAALIQDAHKAVPGVGLVLNRLAEPVRKRIEGTAFERLFAHTTGNDFLLALRAQTLQQIGNSLMQYLADDLREGLAPSLNRAVRAVLFFDSFETVGEGPPDSAQPRPIEEWVREIAAQFDFALTVIAGQNRLKWEDADADWAAELDQQPVGGLSSADARSFLDHCGIAAGALQDAILATARQSEGGFHCFSLGLCADIVYAERRRGREPQPATLDLPPGDWTRLARRYLKSLGAAPVRRWIERLAATPRFDEAAARKAYSGGRSVAQDTEWEALPDYSFVDPLAANWFAIRMEMRRALANQPSAARHAAADHKWWRAYWQKRSRSPVDEFASLAWYHRYMLDPGGALEEWSGLVEAAVEDVPQRMRDHFSLMSWWDPVGLLDRPVSSAQAAEACFALGDGLLGVSLGSQSANLLRAIECFRVVLGFYTEKDYTTEWVATQGGLGAALILLSSGDRAENLRQAMECFRVIEPYVGEAIDPEDFAAQQGLLGLAWQHLPTGSRIDNLGHAMECLCVAVRIYEKLSPPEWALAQLVMGAAWLAFPAGDRAANVRQAMACFHAALTVVGERQNSRTWALAEANIGIAWSELPAGDGRERSENLRRAMESFDKASRVLTEKNFPTDWARVQCGRAKVWLERPDGARAENVLRAIDSYRAALPHLDEQELPQEWAIVQAGSGRAWVRMPAEDRRSNLGQAIDYFHAALRVYKEDTHQMFWAGVQADLGDAWFALAGESRAENLRRAIGCFEAACRVYTEQSSAVVWARLQYRMGAAQLELVSLGHPEEMPRAIASLQASLRVYNERDYPEQHLDAVELLRKIISRR